MLVEKLSKDGYLGYNAELTHFVGWTYITNDSSFCSHTG